MDKPNHTDEQLIKQITEGNQKAFKILFERFYKLLLSIAINVLKDVETSKDMVQEVFFQIWKKRETLEIHSSPKAYLKRATINRCLNHIKAQKRFDSTDQLEGRQSAAPSSIEQLEAADLEQAIQMALNGLPEKCRLVFVMRRQEGMPVKEIAEKLGVSPKTVENQITKALRILKEAVRIYNEKKG